MNKISKKHSFLQILLKSYPFFFEKVGGLFVITTLTILNQKFIPWNNIFKYLQTSFEYDLYYKTLAISFSICCSCLEVFLIIYFIKLCNIAKEMIAFWSKLRYLPLTKKEMLENQITSIQEYYEWILRYIGENKLAQMPIFMQKEIGSSVHECFDMQEIAKYIKENSNNMCEWIISVKYIIFDKK